MLDSWYCTTTYAGRNQSSCSRDVPHLSSDLWRIHRYILPWSYPRVHGIPRSSRLHKTYWPLQPWQNPSTTISSHPFRFNVPNDLLAGTTNFSTAPIIRIPPLHAVYQEGWIQSYFIWARERLAWNTSHILGSPGRLPRSRFRSA